jgi:hypothetical protein
VTVRSASSKQDQGQFRAHRRLVTCKEWNRTGGKLITGREDRIAHVFDADGRVLAESAACDFAVSSLAFLPSAKLCLFRTVNRLALSDKRLCLLDTMTVAAGAAICVSSDRPRVIVAGNGPAALIAVGDKKLMFRDSEILAGSLKKLTMFDLKNGVGDTLQFAESMKIFIPNSATASECKIVMANLNHLHSFVLLSNQSQFLEVLNFSVRYCFGIVDPFHQFHSRTIRDRSLFNRLHSFLLISS